MKIWHLSHEGFAADYIGLAKPARCILVVGSVKSFHSYVLPGIKNKIIFIYLYIYIVHLW